MSLTIKNLCKFAVLGTCFTFFAGYSLAETDNDKLLKRKAQNLTTGYSTGYTVGESLSRLKCQKKRWAINDLGNVVFFCHATENEKILHDFNNGKNSVIYYVWFKPRNGEKAISDVWSDLLITLPNETEIWLTDVKTIDWQLGQQALLAAALDPTKKGRIFPLDNFINFRSKGRYTSLIDLLERAGKM